MPRFGYVTQLRPQCRDSRMRDDFGSQKCSPASQNDNVWCGMYCPVRPKYKGPKVEACSATQQGYNNYCCTEKCWFIYLVKEYLYLKNVLINRLKILWANWGSQYHDIGKWKSMVRFTGKDKTPVTWNCILYQCLLCNRLKNLGMSGEGHGFSKRK